jgi:hypothetical protein
MFQSVYNVLNLLTTKSSENIYLNVSYFLQSSMAPIKWRCSIPNIPPKDIFAQIHIDFTTAQSMNKANYLFLWCTQEHSMGTTNSWDPQVPFTKSKHLDVS